MKDVLLRSEIRLIRCFDFQGEAFDEWATIARFGVGIRIPRFFFDLHRTGRKNCFEPRGQMSLDMEDFESILSVATRSISVRLVFNNLYATAGGIRFFATFFLKKDEVLLCDRSNEEEFLIELQWECPINETPRKEKFFFF